MRTRKIMTLNERGGTRLSAIIAIAILGALVYVCVQVIPILWANWNFEDAIKNKVQFAFINYKDVKKELPQDIKKTLDKMGATYKDKDVKVEVEVDQEGNKKKIIVEVWYSRTHKLPSLPFFQNPKPFYIRVENTPIS